VIAGMVSYMVLCWVGVTKHKLYGKVNSVKNTTINIWLNDGIY